MTIMAQKNHKNRTQRTPQAHINGDVATAKLLITENQQKMEIKKNIYIKPEQLKTERSNII